MESLSALLAICAGNSPVIGEFPAQRPVTRSFDVFFGLRLNKRLSKQWWCWWFETPSRPLWRHCNDYQGCVIPLGTWLCTDAMVQNHILSYRPNICQVSSQNLSPFKYQMYILQPVKTSSWQGIQYGLLNCLRFCQKHLQEIVLIKRLK